MKLRKQLITTKPYSLEDLQEFYKEDLITLEDIQYLENNCSNKLFKIVKLTKNSKIYEIHEYLTMEYTDKTYCHIELK